jgi:hypothetical protein
MILKIENDKKEGYYYYEADEINYYSISMKDAKDAFKNSPADWLVHEGDEKIEDLTVNIFTVLYKDRMNTRNVITTRTVYLLNGNGKTIDRIR